LTDDHSPIEYEEIRFFGSDLLAIHFVLGLFSAPRKVWNNLTSPQNSPPRNFGETPENFDYPVFLG
jgi:hypothetical protein